MNDQPYIHGEIRIQVPPLGAYLPDIQPGVVSRWLGDHFSASDWILCPFGISPLIPVEAARAGFRVLVPVHNPILRFLVHNTASPPSQKGLNSALVKLASSFKGKERLKPHILSLYETDCPLCGRKISASAFLWDKTSREPIQKICRCNLCGEEATVDISDADRDKALLFSEQSPTHARALTRVTSPTDPIRHQVENALASYPPRSVYALFTILNKMTGFSLTDRERSHLEVLLLHAFYRCSQPLDSDRDASETVREENVWIAMEDALPSWTNGKSSVPVSIWPETNSAEGSITIFPGRIKDLTSQLIGFPIRGVVMDYPKPSTGFWSLSALWSGWLWGQETASALRGILSSQDLDWPWMTKAAQRTLTELSEVLPDQIPALGLMPGLDTQSLLSWTSASLAAGLKLEQLAVDPDQAQGQSAWTINPPSNADQEEDLDHKVIIREAGLSFLEKGGEPRHTLQLLSAAVSRLAGSGYPLPGSQMAQAGAYFPRLRVDFEENIAYRQGFLHYQAVDCWWHQELDPASLAHSDLVEISLVRNLLNQKSPVPEAELYQNLYDSFSGLDTPRSSLIAACLASYAELVPGKDPTWQIKETDQPQNRQNDLQEMAGILTEIGTALGFEVQKELAPDNLTLLTWGNNRQIADQFFISASGLLGKVMAAGDRHPQRGWIILPGSRAGLIHFKLEHNPVLAKAVKGKWEMVKYRHLRRLSDQGGLTRGNYRERLCLDPFTSDSPQLPLI